MTMQVWPSAKADLAQRFFYGSPQVELFTAGKARLLQPFGYLAKDGKRHIVPKGFEFDGESIPRVFWRLVGAPFTGCPHAACVHDWYCERANDLTDAEAFDKLRGDADNLYLECLQVCAELGIGGRHFLRAKHSAVRLAGWWGKMRRRFVF